MQRKLWKASKARRAAGKVVALNSCMLSPPSIKSQAQHILKRERRIARLEAKKGVSARAGDVWTNDEIRNAMHDLNIPSLGCDGLGTVDIDDLVCVASKEFVTSGKDHYAIVLALVRTAHAGGGLAVVQGKGSAHTSWHNQFYVNLAVQILKCLRRSPPKSSSPRWAVWQTSST